MNRLLLFFLLPIFTQTYATSSFGYHGTAKNTTSSSIECQCGDRQYLKAPHSNISILETADQCFDYKLIDARGTSEPQAVSMVFYLLIANILSNQTGGISQPVLYPAGLDQNTTSGERYVLEAINKGIQECPNQKYVLFGYSQGATLILSVLSKLDSRAMNKLKATILVGNPYHVPGQLSNVNASAQPDNQSEFGWFATIALSKNSSFPLLSPKLDRSGKVLDYCLEGDGICSYNPECPCDIPAAHLSYGLVENVQSTAFNHVISRLST